MIAGELVRLAQIQWGEETLVKDRVRWNFLRKVPEFPEKGFFPEFWANYIEDRVWSMGHAELEEYCLRCDRFSNALLRLLRPDEGEGEGRRGKLDA